MEERIEKNAVECLCVCAYFQAYSKEIACVGVYTTILLYKVVKVFLSEA